MKKILTVILLAATLICCSASVFADGKADMPFTDVKENHWFYDEVVYAYENGIFDGMTPTTFGPNTAMTRAMFVQTLANIEGVDLKAYKGETDFNDVKESHWYAPAVKWAVEQGIASGVGGGRFNPTTYMSREQLVVMLCNYSKNKGILISAAAAALDGYTDADKVSDWAEEAMRWAVRSGIIAGVDESTLAPKGESTRAQVARILMLYLETFKTDESGVVEIGSERQLFPDKYLIDAKLSDAYINIESPVKQESVFKFDKSYERGDSVYHNIVRMPDGTYRMYYKAYSNLRRICYIESKDGLTWTRPQLTTNRQGGQKTNIVTTESSSPDNLFVFYDTNPACPEGRRLKGVYGQWGEFLAIEYSYSDKGEHFPFGGGYAERVMGKAPTTGGCYYDTLNTMYWDENRQQYVAFVRGFHNEKGNYALKATFVSNYPHKIIRDIRVSFSDDGKTWSMPEPLKYNTTDDYQLYANAITPYYRSPGLYVGLPTRYFEESGDKRTQVFFMSSRDLLNWTRTEEAFLLPENAGSYSYSRGEGYPCVGFIETAEGEMSFYMKHKDSVPTLYRYTLRVDGFTSAMGTRLTTKPFTYKGESLELNFNGELKVTMTNAEGHTVTSDWISGDEIAETVKFNGELPTGESVLTFEMKEGTKLYSFKFN